MYRSAYVEKVHGIWRGHRCIASLTKLCFCFLNLRRKETPSNKQTHQSQIDSTN